MKYLNDVTEKKFGGFYPWPVDRIQKELSNGDTLWKLCQPKNAASKFDVRELSLENLVRDILAENIESKHIFVRRPIGSTIGFDNKIFPARVMPDIVLSVGERFHICEIKSNRLDYSRFDCVFGSSAFRSYLLGMGHTGSDPWEVEQDLIKLRRFSELTKAIGSCIFIMVDAYTGRGRSWSTVFSDINVFNSTMRTDLVRRWGSEILASTTIFPIESKQIKCNLIVCKVFTENLI